MDDNKLRFGVGVLVIASIGIGIILTFLFGAFPTVLAREYTLLVEFPSAAGVSTNTPVLRDGVRIGRVSDIRLLDDEGVLVQLAMKDEHRLSHEYIPMIGVGSVITGDSTLEFVRASPQQLDAIFQRNEDKEIIPTPFSDGEYYRHGRKAQDPFNMLFGLESDVKQTVQNVNQLTNQFRQTVGNTDQRIGKVQEEATETLDDASKTLKELQESGRKALTELQLAIQDVRRIVGDENIRQSVQDAAAALPGVVREAQTTLQRTQDTFKSFENVGKRFDNVGKEFEGIGEVAGVVAKDIKTITERAKTTVDKANGTLDTVKSTVQGAGKTLNTIEGTFQSAERTIKNVERFSEPLAQRSDEIVGQVINSLRSIDRALAEIETVGRTINSDNGSVQRLLKDEELYWHLRRTIENVEQASSRIRPILDDVRIFTDKVARDPRQLGVRGAITRRPNGAGLK